MTVRQTGDMYIRRSRVPLGSRPQQGGNQRGRGSETMSASQHSGRGGQSPDQDKFRGGSNRPSSITNPDIMHQAWLVNVPRSATVSADPVPETLRPGKSRMVPATIKAPPNVSLSLV